jgi:hypothetical protein
MVENMEVGTGRIQSHSYYLWNMEYNSERDWGTLPVVLSLTNIP